jgi:hypothetical protein
VLLKTLRQGLPTAHQLSLTIDLIQLWARTQTHPLAKPHLNWSYIPLDQWFSSLLSNLADTGCSIHIDDTLVLGRGYFTHGLHSQHPTTPPAYTVQRFNMCRMYLQVLWLSEVCNQDGTEISLESWTLTGVTTRTGWPHQFQPSKRNIKAWQQLLGYFLAPKKWILPNGDRRLVVPLGPWVSYCTSRSTYHAQLHGFCYGYIVIVTVLVTLIRYIRFIYIYI